MLENFQLFFQTFSLPITVLFGLILGSFANVMIWRIPRGESIIKPASHCPACNHILSWYENIPVLSYLFLRAKCRNCQSPISIRYPIIEILTALFALWGVMHTANTFYEQLFSIFVSPFIISLIIIDIETLELPDSLVFTVGGIGLLFVGLTNGWVNIIPTLTTASFLIALSILLWWIWSSPDDKEDNTEEYAPTISERLMWGGGGFLLGLSFTIVGVAGQIVFPSFISLWGMLAGSGVLLTLWGFFLFLKGSEYVGIGDIKLMGVIGIPFGPYVVLLGFAFSAMIGIVIWLTLHLFRNQKSTQPFPFGPALILGVWCSWLYGEKIIDWYFNLFLS